MQQMYVLSLTTENTLRVLQRIATIFTRNRLNIEQLNVFETSRKGISHFNIVFHTQQHTVEKLIKQLQRIVELLDVKISNQMALETKELINS